MNMVFLYLMNELPALTPYAVGFSYSIFAGLLIGYTQKYLYLKFPQEQSEWRSRITGLVERGLYTGTTLAGKPEFVGIWLVMKSVAHWERFKTDTKSEGNATSIFNGYFINTGLSLAYGLTGALITNLLISRQCITAIVVMIGLSGTHLLLNQFVRCMANAELSAKGKKLR